MVNSVDSAIGPFDVILEGGPDTLPERLRRQRVDTLTEKVKIRHCGGYEHFGKVDDEEAEDGSVLFRWLGSTRIAE